MQWTYLLGKGPHVTRCGSTTKGRSSGHREARTSASTPSSRKRSSAEIIFIITIRDALFLTFECIGICTTESELSSFGIFDTQVFPVQQRRETFDTVTLADSLTASLASETNPVLSKLY